MSTKPTTVAVATYASRDAAVEDYEIIRGAKHQGELDHLAIAVVAKDDEGKLVVDRHDSTAKHLAWGGAIIGASLVVLVPPLGITTLAAAGAGAGAVASAGALAGAGGLIGHFYRNIPKETVEEMGKTLSSGQAGLLIIAVDPKGLDVEALLTNAEKKIVKTGVTDEKDAEDDALESAFEELSDTSADASSGVSASA
ncbi:hypothetical protein [Leifsonia virtsii]|uniref:DUF1269 domain-containing protein n=1 Tax=Leifsonia virtsii TaxID=3035915 RepID=A0ABT8J1R8_9MICO|nr:hypothetical protein [Leifsonia virtsii]MDN4599021.1 hypothetical protein [Leifsonia virtsii]